MRIRWKIVEAMGDGQLLFDLYKETRKEAEGLTATGISDYLFEYADHEKDTVELVRGDGVRTYWETVSEYLGEDVDGLEKYGFDNDGRQVSRWHSKRLRWR